MLDRRVVVTGLGLLSPLALSLDENWNSLVKGKSGIGPITTFDCSLFPVKIAGEIKNFIPKNFISPHKTIKLMSRATRLAVAATGIALRDSQLTLEKLDSANTGLALGVAGTQYTMEEAASVTYGCLNTNKCKKDAFEGEVSPLWALTALPNMNLCHIAIIYGINGPNVTFSSIVSGGAQALGEAYRAIKEKEADIYIAGGCDALNSITLSAFFLQGLLSLNNTDPANACRPFDLKRNGLVIGEGAAILILEELSHAEKRKAEIYGELIGYSSCFDSETLSYDRFFPVTLEGAARCMKNALQDAGISPGEVDYINAHGEGSSRSDKIETEAIKKVFGSYAYNLPISSGKALMGHLLSASAPADLIITLLAIEKGIVPPTFNCENKDPDCDLDYVSGCARKKRVNIAMSNTFGPGGENSALVVKNYG